MQARNREALIEHKVRCFYLARQDLPASEMAGRFLRNLPAIVRACSRPGPFMIAVYRGDIRKMPIRGLSDQTIDQAHVLNSRRRVAVPSSSLLRGRDPTLGRLCAKFAMFPGHPAARQPVGNCPGRDRRDSFARAGDVAARRARGAKPCPGPGIVSQVSWALSGSRPWEMTSPRLLAMGTAVCPCRGWEVIPGGSSWGVGSGAGLGW